MVGIARKNENSAAERLSVPISNEPNYKQETSRVRTPMEGKRTPGVRLFFEEGLGQSVGCARNCLRQMAKFGYKMSETPKQQRLMNILASSGNKRQGPDDVDDMFKARMDSLFDGAGTSGKKGKGRGNNQANRKAIRSF